MMRVFIVVALLAMLLALTSGVDVSRRTSTAAQLRNRLSYRNKDNDVCGKVAADVFTGYMDEEVSATIHEILHSQKLSVQGQEQQQQNQETEVWSQLIMFERGTVGHTSSDLFFERPLGKIDAHVPGVMTHGSVWTIKKAQNKFSWECHGIQGRQSICGNDPHKTHKNPLLKDLLDKTLKTMVDPAQATEFYSTIDNELVPPAKHKLGRAKVEGAFRFSFVVLQRKKEISKRKAAILMRAPEMGLQSSLVYKALKFSLALLPANSIVNLYGIGASGAAGKTDDHDDCPGCIFFVERSIYIGGKYAGSKGKFKNVIEGRDLESSAVTNVFADDAQVTPSDEAKKVHYKDAKRTFEALKGKPDNDQHMAKILPVTGKGHVDTTINYFGGHPTKLASQHIKSHSVNMEDAHVIHAFRDLIEKNRVCNAGVFRVDADPVTITEDMAKEVNAWIKAHPTIKLQTYKDIKAWVAKGMPMSDVSKLCWTGIIGTHIKAKHFIKPSGSECVVNPFYMEIAADMKNEFAKAVMQNGDATPEQQCAKLWQLAGDKIAFEGNKQTDCPLWVRSGHEQAGGSTFDPAVPISGTMKLTDGAVDRLLYKANNFAGLEKLNKLLFRNEPKTIKDQSVLNKNTEKSYLLPLFIHHPETLKETCKCQ